MATSTIDDLRQRALEIKEETDIGDNTAERVGTLFEKLIDLEEEQTEAIARAEQGSVLMEPLIGINAMQAIPGDGQSIKFKNGKWVFYTPSSGGGDGGSSSSGRQRSFFLNVNAGVIPTAPIPDNYNAGNDTFTNSGYTWKATNVNPTSGQSTYIIWVWFSGAVPQAIDGPIMLFDGSMDYPSNGVDSTSIEWVYMRTTVLLEEQSAESIRNSLANCTSAQDSNWSTEGKLPNGWNNHPSGIDSINKYEYAAYRVSSIDANGKRVWGKTGFVGPLLWSAYGEKGMDGDGVEYIFYATMGNTSLAGQRPDEWDASQEPEYTGPEGSNWEDEPIDLETLGQGAIEWVSMRKFTDGAWGKFSAPKVWSRLGEDGIVDGYTVDLINDTMPVGTDSDGLVKNYKNSARVQVFYNNRELVFKAPTLLEPELGANNFYCYVDSDNIYRSDDPERNPINNLSVTQSGASFTVNISNNGITDFGGKNLFIPIKVELPNKTTRTLIITLFGVAVGEAGQTIDMWVSAKALRVANDHSVAPSIINVGVKIGQGNSVKLYTGSNIPKKFTFKYWYDTPALPSDEITIENTEKTFELVAGIEEEGKWKPRSTVTVAMYYNGVFIDSDELPFINNGVSGSTVKNVTRWYCAMSTMTIPAFVDDDPIDGEPDDNIDSDQDSDGKDTWTTERPEDYGENKPYLYAADVTEWSTGGYTVSPVWLLETYGSDAYDLVVEPSYLIFDGEYNKDTGEWSGSSPKSSSIAVQVFNGDNPLYINIATQSISKPSNITVKPASQDNNTKKIITVTPTGDSITNGKVTFTVKGAETSGGNTVFTRTVSVPVYINRAESKLFSIKGQLQNYTNEQIADGLTDYVTQTTYNTDIEATEKKLRSEYTETIRRAGDYNPNLFGFHKDVEFGRFVPFIQSYGIVIPKSLWVWNNYIGENGKHYGYIKNLGFKGVGGLFTISFKARTSSQYNKSVEFRFWTNKKCSNTNTVNINNSWKEYTLQYTLDLDVTDVTDTNAKNSIPEGELQICTSSNDFDLFIRELKIERGNIKTLFYEAEEDLSYFDDEQLISNLSFNSDYISYSSNTEVEKKTGVYYTPNAIVANKLTGNFVDLLYQNASFNIKAGCVYTLSYWAKFSNTNEAYITSYLYDSVNNLIQDVANNIYIPGNSGSIIAGVKSDGETFVRLSNEWKHYFIRFYATNSISKASLIVARYVKKKFNSEVSLNGLGQLYISDIKFQEGYAVEPNYYGSLLQQTARGISLLQQTGLKKAGIDIYNGKVDVQADQFTIRNSSGQENMSVNENGDVEFRGVIKGTYAYNVQVYDSNNLGHIDAATDYFMYAQTGNTEASLILPHAATCKGKRIVISNVYLHTQGMVKLYAFNKDKSIGDFDNIVVYDDVTQSSTANGYDISEIRSLVVWSDPSLIGPLDNKKMGWRILEIDKH